MRGFLQNLAVLAVAAMIGACSSQGLVASESHYKDNISVRCPAATQQFCRASGSRVKGNNQRTSCWCDRS